MMDGTARVLAGGAHAGGLFFGQEAGTDEEEADDDQGTQESRRERETKRQRWDNAPRSIERRALGFNERKNDCSKYLEKNIQPEQ